MGILMPYTTWGRVKHKGRNCGVLSGSHLREDLWEACASERQERGEYSFSPWTRVDIEWEVDDGCLYLYKVCREGFLQEHTGKERLLADWMDEIPLVWEIHRFDKPIDGKTHEYEVLKLILKRGCIIGEERETRRYYIPRLKDYIQD